MGELAKRLRLTRERALRSATYTVDSRACTSSFRTPLTPSAARKGWPRSSRALDKSAPWAGVVVEAIGESLPPVKFLLKLFEGLAKVDDPQELGSLAFTLAYQHAVQQALPEVIGMAAHTETEVRRALTAPPNRDCDFAQFSAAVLGGADLSGANFSGANLRGARVTQVRLNRTQRERVEPPRTRSLADPQGNGSERG